MDQPMRKADFNRTSTSPCVTWILQLRHATMSQVSDVVRLSGETVDGQTFMWLSALLALLTIACEEIGLDEAGFPLSTLVECLLLCSLAVFTFELAVLSLTRHGYLWSVWFPLDLLATLTLLMDMPWFQRLAFDEGCFLFSPMQDHVARVGGTTVHAIRVARALRVLRLARLVKLYKLASCLVSNASGIAFLSRYVPTACFSKWRLDREKRKGFMQCEEMQEMYEV
eukprot:TRINITY_DN40679_c0_g1_i1.p1 TRINITY_DN40679_c0_g1~~TRINITY_DN40679_c0_g1_i1.p1  ORF type:complete len:226 (+),score=34.29 TRINITY_DN40679_c0_g1_i1:99-776(+)